MATLTNPAYFGLNFRPSILPWFDAQLDLWDAPDAHPDTGSEGSIDASDRSSELSIKGRIATESELTDAEDLDPQDL